MTPDIVTMAKALTNGAIRMRAVAARDAIYQTITGAAPKNAMEFFHGYTYPGHPAACVAGPATLGIYSGRVSSSGRRTCPRTSLKRSGRFASSRSSATFGATA